MVSRSELQSLGRALTIGSVFQKEKGLVMGNCISGGGGGRRTVQNHGDHTAAQRASPMPQSPAPSLSARRSESIASPQLAGLSPRRSSSVSSASPKLDHSTLEVSSNASPTTQRLHKYLSLLNDIKSKGISTDHPEVKVLDAELQPKLIDAQNKKYPGLNLSLLSVKERDFSEFTKRLLETPEASKWRAIVNTESRDGDALIDHAVAVEVSRQGGQLSLVIMESLARKNRCADLAHSARWIKNAAVSIVLTEVQRGYAGCKIHSLHQAVEMHKEKNLRAMEDLHAKNFAALSSEAYSVLDEETFSKVEEGVKFLPAGFFKHVTSHTTLDRLPSDVKNKVQERFDKNYRAVWNIRAEKTDSWSTSIDEERVRYAKLALQS